MDSAEPKLRRKDSGKDMDDKKAQFKDAILVEQNKETNIDSVDKRVVFYTDEEKADEEISEQVKPLLNKKPQVKIKNVTISCSNFLKSDEKESKGFLRKRETKFPQTAQLSQQSLSFTENSQIDFYNKPQGFHFKFDPFY